MEFETLPLRTADRLLAEKRFRALGVRRAGDDWEAHPETTDGEVPDRVTFLSPVRSTISFGCLPHELLVDPGVHYRPVETAR